VRGALLLVALASLPAYADDSPHPTPFDQGRVSIFGGGGTGQSLGYHYVVVGAGVGYFVLDGVELSLHGSYQWGDGPSISELSPELRYIAQPLVGQSPVLPYIGVSYHHWFVGDPYEDVDTVAGRAGGLMLSGRVVWGLGVVVEHIVSDCISNCNSVYPDITLGFTL